MQENLRSWIREQLWATHVPDQTFTILSSRTLLRCESGLPRNTQNCTGIMGNVFWTTTCSRRTTLYSLQQFKEFGIFVSGFETWNYRNSKETQRNERESLNSPTPSPHFQVDVECWIILLELILTVVWWIIREFLRRNGIFENFLTLWIVQSWKINFRTEVCLRTADPQITMLWIKEFEIPKSIDELVTSRSITGQHNFPDFDMFDAMIAPALKKLLSTQSNFWKRVSVEEQWVQKDDGRQIAHTIDEYFFATRAFEAVQGLADLFTMSLENDDVQDLDVRWDHAPLSVSEMPPDVVLEGI